MENTPVPATGPARLITRTQERYRAVQALVATGRSVSAISQTLVLDRTTVRRFGVSPVRSPT